jgi:hypothetical protein
MGSELPDAFQQRRDRQGHGPAGQPLHPERASDPGGRSQPDMFLITLPENPFPTPQQVAQLPFAA